MGNGKVAISSRRENTNYELILLQHPLQHIVHPLPRISGDDQGQVKQNQTASYSDGTFTISPHTYITRMHPKSL